MTSYYNDVILSYRCLHTNYLLRWMSRDLLWRHGNLHTNYFRPYMGGGGKELLLA